MKNKMKLRVAETTGDFVVKGMTSGGQGILVHGKHYQDQFRDGDIEVPAALNVWVKLCVWELALNIYTVRVHS